MSIELLEKDSGFIRLDLRVAHPEDYIDCGHAVYQPPNEEFAFDCPYAQYLNRFRDVQLVGSMNIYVRALDEQTTFVRVHTRYVFGEWVFETGSSHTRKTGTGFSTEISNPEARDLFTDLQSGKLGVGVRSGKRKQMTGLIRPLPGDASRMRIPGPSKVALSVSPRIRLMHQSS